MRLSQLAQKLGLEHQGADCELKGVAPAEEAQPGDLSFLVDRKRRHLTAEAFITTRELARELDKPCLISRSPAVDFGRAAQLFGRQVMTLHGRHPTAMVDPSAFLEEGVALGAHVVIGPGVHVGPDTVVHAGAVIHERSEIGARCVIHGNVVIGGDGFGFESVEGRHTRIPHLGIVRIGDDVEIGACTTIDRARFGETVVGDGTKIDNLVQVGHNVRIGKHCLIMAQVGLAGSVRVEDGVIIAGQSGVVPHVTIGAGAMIAASTGVAGDVPARTVWSGWWGQEHRQNLEQLSALRKLPALMKQVQAFLKKQGA